MTIPCRVRTHEGSGLTIRIPRQLTADRSSAHSAAHPLVSPDRNARNSHVVKSKSFTTNMDKLAAAQAQQQQQHGSGGSSRDSSRPCSRGSTPSSSRSSAPSRTPSRPPSRRSHPTRSSRSPDPDSLDTDERGIKSDSPCGSEVSLHSAKSGTSAKSSASAKSNASAKSSVSTKSNASSTRSNLSGRSSASARSSGSAKSDKSDKSREAVKSPGASLKSGVPARITKARSPAPTHGATEPTHTPTRRRSSLSNGSSASSADTSHHNGMANGEQSTPRRTTPPRYTPPRNSGAGTPRHTMAKKSLPVFNSYMSLFQVQEKLKKGEVIEGVLRINPKNYEDAYISAPDGGMDIYIGGVRDRNAALHGDVVVAEIKATGQWKVLYDQLDQYLENHTDLKEIVYSPLESNITASVADAAFSYNPVFNKTNKEKGEMKKQNIKTSDPIQVASVGPLAQCDSDVVVEEEDESDMEAQKNVTGKKKKKKRNRRKRKSKSKSCDTEEPTENDNSQDDSQIAVVMLQTEPVKVKDELILLTSPTLVEGGHTSNGDNSDSDEGSVKGIAVPPDQLSEHDFTDDESGCSEILDYNQEREDQSFMQAQWEAYKKEKEQKQEESQDYHRKSEDEQGLVVSTKVTLKEEVSLGLPDGFVKCKKEGKNKDNVVLEEGIGEKVSSASVNIVKKEESINVTVKSDAPENTETTQGGRGKRTIKRKTPELSKLQQEVEEKIKSLGLDHAKITVKSEGQKEAAAQSKDTRCSNTYYHMGEDKNLNVGKERAFQGPYNQMGTNFARKKNWQRGPQIEATKHTEMITVGNRPRRQTDRVERTEPSIAQVQRLPNWEDFIQRTAHVVDIREKKHTRIAAGILKLFQDKNPNYALFSPNDSRVPRMKVPMIFCPLDFFARHQDYLERIFLAKITKWIDPKFAEGELVRDVGAVGDIEAETEAMLYEHNIDYQEFSEEINKNLPSLPWSIPAEEISARVDLRKECIFTIDPSTARDLDDALSCVPLSNGNFRVGVHIADVTYFLEEKTPLDLLASQRATTFYLPQKAIPMLPGVLSQHLCSLNPGEDRLAFSVIWELSPNGDILGEWFGRSVIHSCAKLSYEHAQSMIDEPDRQWLEGEIPTIHCGYTSRDVSRIINNLQSIALKLRQRRFKNGALRLDQVKIQFNLDWETKVPNGFFTEERKDSHKLVEELMLLANISVAHKIYQSFPEVALLRRHPPPCANVFKNVIETLSALGVQLDPTSPGSLYHSISRYAGNDKYSEARFQAIVNMCSKPMQHAKYFCTGMLENEAQFHHYALNVPLYTHFTSPIRRYPDVIVHRLLAAAVDSTRYKKPTSAKEIVQKCAEHCNDKKQTSKIVQEQSTEMFLALFIRQVKELVEEGMVVAILDHSFDILLLNVGLIKRVYTDKLPLESIKHDKLKRTLTLFWQADASGKKEVQTVGLFSLVTVILRPVDSKALKFNAVLVRPS